MKKFTTILILIFSWAFAQYYSPCQIYTYNYYDYVIMYPYTYGYNICINPCYHNNCYNYYYPRVYSRYYQGYICKVINCLIYRCIYSLQGIKK